MRAFVIGSKELSCQILETLLDQGYEVLGVYVRDGEPGMKVWHQLGHRSLANEAEKHGIPVYHDMNVNSDESCELLMRLNLDIILSCFWSQIFKERVLNIPKLGIFNFHTAYLPQNRGSRPIPWSLIKGESHCGITVHKMMTGVDNGPIVAQKAVNITDNDTGETLYNKVTEAAEELASKVIRSFSDNTFTLSLQDEKSATYHPRGEPFGRQVNPYWTADEVNRFERAFVFPPFKGAVSAPPNALDGKAPRLYVMLGIECDERAVSIAAHEEYEDTAHQLTETLQNVKETLDKQNIGRTYFLHGRFVESVSRLVGKNILLPLLQSDSSSVEIGDSSSELEQLNKEESQPIDRIILQRRLKDEFRLNTTVLQHLFGSLEQNHRGLSAITGFYQGLKAQFKTLDTLQKLGLTYLCTDMKGEEDALNPSLFDNEENIRQPYRYENGLLEIPTFGWQNNSSVKSDASIVEKSTASSNEVLSHYEDLFRLATNSVKANNRDIFLGIKLKLATLDQLNSKSEFFIQLKELLDALNGEFLTYSEVCDHYNSTYE